MYMDKDVKDSEKCAMHNFKKSKADYTVKTLRLPCRESIDDVRVASRSSPIIQCLPRMVYVKNIDQYMPPKGVDISEDIIQCYIVRESGHYLNGGHYEVKDFLEEYDQDSKLSNLLYTKAKFNKGVKHVAFFCLGSMEDGKQITYGGKIVICFKCFEPRVVGGEDVLMYDTAYYTEHPNPAMPGEISYSPTTIIECSPAQYNSIRGLGE